MWLEIANTTGVVQGMLNLERVDIVKLGPSHGDSYYELTVTKGTASKVYYIDGTDLNKLNHYLDTKRS